MPPAWTAWSASSSASRRRPQRVPASAAAFIFEESACSELMAARIPLVELCHIGQRAVKHGSAGSAPSRTTTGVRSETAGCWATSAGRRSRDRASTRPSSSRNAPGFPACIGNLRTSHRFCTGMWSQSCRETCCYSTALQPQFRVVACVPAPYPPADHPLAQLVCPLGHEKVDTEQEHDDSRAP